MAKNDKSKMSWEAFQSLGNPENAPEMPAESEKTEDSKSDQIIRIRRDKKLKGGKVATVIEGVELPADELKNLAKDLKIKCGVGGAVKEGAIILQGDHRKRILDIFLSMGYSNSKLSGG